MEIRKNKVMLTLRPKTIKSVCDMPKFSGDDFQFVDDQRTGTTPFAMVLAQGARRAPRTPASVSCPNRGGYRPGYSCRAGLLRRQKVSARRRVAILRFRGGALCRDRAPRHVRVPRQCTVHPAATGACGTGSRRNWRQIVALLLRRSAQPQQTVWRRDTDRRSTVVHTASEVSSRLRSGSGRADAFTCQTGLAHLARQPDLAAGVMLNKV
jgi:hypothetical protein